MPDASVNLIVTSPPYADARKSTYGGISPDRYVEWFLPRATEFKRVLHPRGTFILNIKERVVDGERHTYVLDIIKALRDQGWLWTEDWIWAKKNSTPGKWPNRFRDEWEHVLQFTVRRDFARYQDDVRGPAKDSTVARVQRLNANDLIRLESDTQSGFGKRMACMVGRETVYPSNVLHMATECGNVGHPAAFPESLPDFFIRLFTKPGDLVLDPFAGSGTTLMVAQRLGRDYVGVELNSEYIPIIEKRLGISSAA